MKLLHVADLHLQDAWLDWVSSHCAEFDALVIAGDLLDSSSPTPREVQVATVSDWLLRLRVPTVVCSGNHDDFGSDAWAVPDAVAGAQWLQRLRGRGNIVATDGDTVEIGGVTIAVSGWGMAPDLSARTDILITHAPPSGCYCAASRGMDLGDPGLHESPRVPFPAAWLLCGHVHQPQRLWCHWPTPDAPTLVLVPGVDETSEAPPHWLIDTRRGVAVHSSGEVAQL